MDFGDELAAAWNTHDVENLIRLFAPTCRYTDTPFRLTWEGHEGIRKLFDATSAFHPDYTFVRTSGFHDGSHYAWEWTTSGTIMGQYLTYSGVSLGTLDDKGLIAENRDYWNPKDVPGLGG